MVQNADKEFRAAIDRDVRTSGRDDVVQYLNQIKERASVYLTEDSLCGRANISADIKGVMLEKGNLAFVTGGRSVGKSKIMHSIGSAIADAQASSSGLPTNVPRVSVLLVDGRDYRELVPALNALATSPTTAIIHNVLPASFTGDVPGFDFQAVDFSKMSVAEAVRTLASKRPQDANHTVLILDEANAFLNTAGNEAAARDLFDALVKYTKQLNLMTALLVSSDGGLPFHLKRLGINPDHINHTLVIGEPTPWECRELLQNYFGVGEHLTNALLGCYGGSVYQLVKFLQLLPSAFQREQSTTLQIFQGPASGVDDALDAWLADGGEENEIVQVLGELARTGFVAMRPASKLAQLLTTHNVCASLTRGAVVYHIPEGVRAGRVGLVPSSQLLRVLTAWVLEQMKVHKQGMHKRRDRTQGETEKLISRLAISVAE